MPPRDLFTELWHYFGQPEADRRNWHHVQCPNCGKEPDAIKPNFSFNRRMGKCLSCQFGGGLKTLAMKVGLWSMTPGQRQEVKPLPPAPAPKEEEPVTWPEHITDLMESYANHPQRFQLWQNYKDVSKQTIIKHNFGVGVLPEQHMTRLIVPLYRGNKIVGLKGRALPGVEAKAKWIAARGSDVTLLWGFDFVRKNTRQLWICENYVDAALVRQVEGVDAISPGGARPLTLNEVYAIRSLQPVEIVVAYDNDLVGSPHRETRKELERAWKEEWKSRHPNLTPPKPPGSNAEEVAKMLCQAGLPATVFPWPRKAPHKADIYWALTHDMTFD